MSERPSKTSSGWIADLHFALAFLTRLPLPPLGLLPEGALAHAMRAFPLAGALLGLLAGGVFLAAAPLLTPLPAGVLAVLALVWLSRGLHEDGLADMVDGLSGGHDRERRLLIMRDSRIGSHGAAALMLAMLLRAAALAALGAWALWALVTAGALSRAAIPLMMAWSQPARADGLGKGAGRPSAAITATACLLGVALAAALLPAKAALLAVAVVVTVAAIVTWITGEAIGGYTGDTLGATALMAETAALLAVLAAR